MSDDLPFRATGISNLYEGVTRLPVEVILDNVRSLYNVGAFFRTADAVGVERLHLTGFTGGPPDRRVTKTALGSEASVAWERSPHASTVADALRARGLEIAAVETTTTAVDLFDWQPRFPVCVLFGHEVDGIARELLERADTHVRIPMLGRKGSLNVATAGGVVLYELLRKYRGLVTEARRQPS